MSSKAYSWRQVRVDSDSLKPANTRTIFQSWPHPHFISSTQNFQVKFLSQTSAREGSIIESKWQWFFLSKTYLKVLYNFKSYFALWKENFSALMANILQKGNAFYRDHSVKSYLLLQIFFPLCYPEVISSVFLSCNTKHLIFYQLDRQW